MSDDGKTDVCMVGGEVYRGNASEWLAARLAHGDTIEFRRKGSQPWERGEVARVRFYDGPVVDLVGGHRSLHPACGDEIRPVCGEWW